MNQSGSGSAWARAALAGNPSDGYRGAVLAVTLPSWEARATATRADTPQVTPASRLVAATRERFVRDLHPRAAPCVIQWDTTIPQSVGLGGSSAIVIAVTRALCELHGLSLEPTELADFALAVETEELGIVAGLQDRAAQSFGGLTFMDFSAGRPSYEQLDPGLLPELLVAWHEDAAGHSGDVHAELRARHAAGDPVVRGGMARLAAAARTARDALLAGDRDSFLASLDESFDLRRTMMQLDESCIRMIEVARGAGASANYTGSGGAVVVAAAERETLERAAAALQQTGVPTVSGRPSRARSSERWKSQHPSRAPSSPSPTSPSSR